MQTIKLALTAVFIVSTVSALEAKDHSVVQFERIRLSQEYYAEGAGVGDFNGDGKRDVVCGPLWFEGPEFKTKHKFYDGKAYPNDRGYSNNFFSFASDISGDGKDDVLVLGLPGTPAYWYENSGSDAVWKRHLLFSVVDNEAPFFEDVTGDKKPELICTYKGRLGYLAPDASDVLKPWIWHSISAQGKWHKYSHGLGVGDINGDGRKDFLVPSGWWEQPESLAGDPDWKRHEFRFCGGGAQIYTCDVDGDGDNDVITSLEAHAYGLSWYENVRTDKAPGITFRHHRIMGKKPEDSAGGVCFSQLHALVVTDVDGDGLQDIVTGKCYWAHNGGDPGARDPAVLYWFRLVRDKGKVSYVPHLIDNDSGVGRCIEVIDVTGDGKPDVVMGNKKGTFVFRQKSVTAR